MITKECKRLAEVDFPIAAVSAHSAREKSIRHGHPSTLHLWWARRPLAACRSMLMALLLPDPCDPHCPAAFKDAARRILLEFPGRPGRWDEELDSKNGKAADAAMRKALLHEFIADFANWDNAANPAFLKTARALVKAAHGDEAPLVVDPFAGGGSIPLEALRIGCDAFASDLNPVACLINKVLLEDIPRHGPKLAEELRRVGAEIKREAEAELAEFYPPDPGGARPIAYVWGRTVRCEQPDCGARIPLLRTGWLAARKTKSGGYKKLVSLDLSRDGMSNQLAVQINTHRTPVKNLPDAGHGTIKGGKATCVCCGRTMPAKSVKAQLVQQHGGTDMGSNHGLNNANGATLLAVVVRTDGGLMYRLPEQRDFKAITAAASRERAMRERLGPDSFPNEPISPIRPSPNARGVSGATRIGITDFGRLFNARQKIAIRTLLDVVSRVVDAESIARALGLGVTKLSERSSSFVTWINSTEAPRGTFARQALTIAWDFIELVPIADDEEYLELIEAMSAVADIVANVTTGAGQVEQASAARIPLPDQSASVVFTDPPYYDAIPYADLSDFFLTWLKRSGHIAATTAHLDESTGLSPKSEECTWNQAHLVNGLPKSRASFEAKISEAFAQMRRVLAPQGIASVVFAHKTTEGWEALLTGMIRAGFSLRASWPIATERSARLNAKEAAALATSVHLVCRPRDDNASVGDWGEIIRELPKRIGDWMERLSSEGIRGADLVFACIGPALELFSKHTRVETPDGEEVGLAANDRALGEPARRGFLSYVWEFAGRTALNQVLGSAESRARNGAAGALEEDARLTALFLWTLQATESAANGKAAKKAAEAEDDEADDADEGDDDGEETGAKKGKKKAGLSLIYDVARRFAQPLGIHLDVWEGRIIETAKGVVRLLPVGERAKQLFGEDGASAVVRRFDSAKKPDPQGMLDFMAEQRAAAVPEVKGRGRKKKDGAEASPESLRAKREATTLDRVHAAMLLQDSGATNALRALLEAEVERGPDFLRLANALSALYPRDSEEKRLLDAMLLAVPR